MSNISDKLASELLITAFEGGSNYWYMIEGIEKPEQPLAVSFEYSKNIHPYGLLPFNGGAVLICDADECDDEGREVWRLDRDAVELGKKLIEEDADCYNDLVGENWDADTSDAFLQLCLFGEMVYG